MPVDSIVTVTGRGSRRGLGALAIAVAAAAGSGLLCTERCKKRHKISPLPDRQTDSLTNSLTRRARPVVLATLKEREIFNNNV